MQAVTANSWHLHKSSLFSGNMTDSLPDKFDVIIIGTGFKIYESICSIDFNFHQTSSAIKVEVLFERSNGIFGLVSVSGNPIA